MPFGKTLEIIEESRKQFWRVIRPRETYPRDRSLRGKDRIRARKAANKASREQESADE